MKFSPRDEKHTHRQSAFQKSRRGYGGSGGKAAANREKAVRAVIKNQIRLRKSKREVRIFNGENGEESLKKRYFLSKFKETAAICNRDVGQKRGNNRVRNVRGKEREKRAPL